MEFVHGATSSQIWWIAKCFAMEGLFYWTFVKPNRNLDESDVIKINLFEWDFTVPVLLVRLYEDLSIKLMLESQMILCTHPINGEELFKTARIKIKQTPNVCCKTTFALAKPKTNNEIVWILAGYRNIFIILA